ncbi:MAG: class I SAM-dependent methyltransferase [Desulfurivibrionaceae bacterium]
MSSPEDLPFAAGSSDHALVVTVICFAHSPVKMLAEAHRVIKAEGRLLIGFIDRDSTSARITWPISPKACFTGRPLSTVPVRWDGFCQKPASRLRRGARGHSWWLRRPNKHYQG